MSPRAIKDKKRDLHLQPIDPVLAIGFLAVFAMLVGAYLVANFKYSAMPTNINPAGSESAATISGVSAVPKKSAQLLPFKSSDDFKSYLDDGKRAYGDGVFEAQNLTEANLAEKAGAASALKTAVSKPVKNQKTTDIAPVTAAEAQKFFSLGHATARGGDIFAFKGSSLFFSPENQFYLSAPVTGGGLSNDPNEISKGETKIFDISQADSIAQTNFIPRDGNLIVSDNFLAVMSGNLISAYNISNEIVPRDIWQARISEGTTITAVKTIKSKLYLALKTNIDAANPCPAKPLVSGDGPFIIECGSIYHPENPVLADSIFTVFEVDMTSGQIDKNISFVGSGDGSSVLIGDNGIYAFWSQSGDYISFFTAFLQEKCKSLLPNYLLEKAAILPEYNIALSSKELELRALLSNWISSLSPDEQARVANEVNARMKDYLRDHYQDYEKTGIAAADIGTFKFVSQTQVPGRISDSSMIDEYGANIRLVSSSGRGAAQKMAWLVTGKIVPEDPQKILNSIYVFDDKLAAVGAAENLDLPAEICAVAFDRDRVYATTCRPADSLYSIGLSARTGLGTRAELPAVGSSYFYVLNSGAVLDFSKNNRKIQISLIDAALPSKPTVLFKYDLNDYWADLDGNYPAFSVDSAKKTFFVPVARGGYIFSIDGGQIVLKKAAGSFAVSRSFFKQGFLYLAGDDGIEVFGGEDWAKTKSIKF